MKLFILALVSANSAKFREPSGKHVKYRILNIYYTLSQKHFMAWECKHKSLAIVLFKLPEMTGKIPRARMSYVCHNSHRFLGLFPQKLASVAKKLHVKSNL